MKMAETFKLIRKKEASPTVEPEKKKKEKIQKPPKKNPFKKGSWKAYLYKLLKKWRSSKYVEDFHFVKLENIVIYKKDKPKAILHKKMLSKDEIKRLQDKFPDCYILINSYDNMYSKISLASYLLLMDVDKIAIDFHLQALYDGEDEIYDVYKLNTIYDNINDLMSFINYHRQGIAGVYEVQAQCCCYTDFMFKFKIVVMKRDGTTETYKGDMNEFMTKYKLRPF